MAVPLKQTVNDQFHDLVLLHYSTAQLLVCHTFAEVKELRSNSNHGRVDKRWKHT